MAYNGLTNIGSEYLAKCLANKTGVTFTKIKVGNGSIPKGKTGQETTDLYGFKKEVEILSKSQVENAIKLTVLLNNINLEAGFYVKELGVYIQDGEQEKLYWYINKDNPSFLPDKNTPSNHRYNLYLEVSPVETTVVNFTGEDLLADKKFVEDSIKDFETKNNKTIEELKTLINGKAPASHKHKKSEITDFPTSMKNPTALTIKQNGKNPVAYDGETAKEVNITPAGIGAEPAITKKSGFNLDKSDAVNEDNSNKLSTAKAVKTAYDKANSALTEANKKLNKGSLPALVTDAKVIYDLLENNGGLNIDTALLYLNDAGTKTAGKVYFDRNKKGMFECIETTTSTVNSTNYFVDISNKASSDKLKNLFTMEIINNILIKKYFNGIMEQTGFIYLENIGEQGSKFKIVDFPIKFIKIFSKVITAGDSAPAVSGAVTASYPDQNNLFTLYGVNSGTSLSKAISWHVIGTWK